MYSEEFTTNPTNEISLVNIFKEYPLKMYFYKNMTLREYIKKRLLKFLDKSVEKGLSDLSYVHRLLFEFTTVAQPNEIYALAQKYKDALPAILVTEDGSLAATKMIGHCTAKVYSLYKKRKEGRCSSYLKDKFQI